MTSRSQFPWKRLLAFVALPAVSALTPLLAVPSLTHNLGPGGWGAVAVGQAVGVTSSMVVDYGWYTVGPSRLALASEVERVELLRKSLAMRVGLFCLMAPLAFVTTVLLVDEFGLGCGLVAVTYTMWGLSSNWYFIGTGEPRKIAMFDTIPRAVGTLVASGALFVWPSPAAFALVVGLLQLISLSWLTLSLAGRPTRSWTAGIRSEITSQGTLTIGRIMIAGFTTLSTPVVALAAPAAVPLFAAGDRFRMLGITAVLAVATAFQGWIEADTPGERRRRFRIALAATTSVGLAGAIAITVLLPLVDSWVFSGHIDVPMRMAATIGATTFVVGVAASLTFHSIARSQRTHYIAAAGAVGFGVGVLSIYLMSKAWGAEGGTVGVLVAEFASVVVLFLGHRRVAELMTEVSR